MARTVKAEIGPRRQIQIEFSGFPGESCFEEAEKLKGVLKELGLWAIPVTVTPKTSAEIAREIGEDAVEKRKVPHL